MTFVVRCEASLSLSFQRAKGKGRSFNQRSDDPAAEWTKSLPTTDVRDAGGYAHGRSTFSKEMSEHWLGKESPFPRNGHGTPLPGLCILYVAGARRLNTVEEGGEIISAVKSAILPVDLPNMFLGAISEQRREPDGLLHCSSDLRSPLRYVQLRAVGAPTIPRPIAQDIRMFHGTMWHNWFHDVIEKSGIQFKYEVNLNEYLPKGWGGTADWLFWHPTYEAWVLGDLKTARGEGMFFINKDGAKEDHIWQLSAYWYALERVGIPLVRGFGIMYWPMNDTPDTVDITPVVQDCQPIPRAEIHNRMEDIRIRVDAYRTAYAETGEYLNDKLAPMPEREQKYYWNKQMGVFDVKLVPVWYERFCDFDETLSPRSKTEKVGHYTLAEQYVPRGGYEGIRPTVVPTKAEFNKRRK